MSGFGLGIGSCIVSGALEEIYRKKESKVEERLKLRPFPQYTSGKLFQSELWTKYRKEMLTNVGISIFIFGNKKDDQTGEIIDANGMEEEYDISIKNGIIPIPVSATGFTAHKLWMKVMDNFDDLIGIDSLKPLYQRLGDNSLSDQQLIDLIIQIINNLITFRENY